MPDSAGMGTTITGQRGTLLWVACIIALSHRPQCFLQEMVSFRLSLNLTTKRSSNILVMSPGCLVHTSKTTHSMSLGCCFILLHFHPQVKTFRLLGRSFLVPKMANPIRRRILLFCNTTSILSCCIPVTYNTF